MKNSQKRTALIVFILIIQNSIGFGQSEQYQEDLAALTRTADSVRAAFFNGDVKTIMKYHHPDVIKALGPDKLLVGRKAVESDLRGTLENFNLEFIKNEVENQRVNGDTSFKQILFSLKGTPKQGGESWTFSGRTLVISVRYDKSPTGWAIMHEIIQPFREE
jgi:ketosteroid isomerase-like protein